MFYLTEKDFSPRFDETFFTCSIVSRTYSEAPPLESLKNETPQNRHHPAVYYEIKVRCGHKEQVVFRRYSQFRSLFDALRKNPPNPSDKDDLAQIHVPPKTCPFFRADEEFLENRQEELGIFLEHILKRPNCATHPAVRQFLRLDDFQTQAI